MQATTSTSTRESGKEEIRIMTGIYIQRQQEVLCHLGQEPMKDILIFNQL